MLMRTSINTFRRNCHHFTPYFTNPNMHNRSAVNDVTYLINTVQKQENEIKKLHEQVDNINIEIRKKNGSSKK